ncbi:hypothetical protein BDF20DRAFT_867259 [Mycotypha africana]|uniref:uncharacterized protein n=1 Tax=Mycotypha africana TaxID=64632 RepID=UPI0023008154|nr:uncharacterized protein BDF20DRAFT_867259 [Mycotypha africana]KAI8982488.1 hypothetical protein BDF20DRAFT_867259 [Mycotypha africana]
MSRSPERMHIDEDIHMRGRGASGSTRRLDKGNNKPEELQPVRSIEGWIIVVRNLNEETDEEALVDRFMEYGTVKNVHLNLDRQTGYVKGYAFIEYEARNEAESAVMDADGTEFLDKVITVDYAFVKGQPPAHKDDRDRRDRRHDRSLSPRR